MFYLPRGKRKFERIRRDGKRGLSNLREMLHAQLGFSAGRFGGFLKLKSAHSRF